VEGGISHGRCSRSIEKKEYEYESSQVQVHLHLIRLRVSNIVDCLPDFKHLLWLVFTRFLSFKVHSVKFSGLFSMGCDGFGLRR
jgi:hypothetical protein